jgi:hypothetical protein
MQALTSGSFLPGGRIKEAIDSKWFVLFILGAPVLLYCIGISIKSKLTQLVIDLLPYEPDKGFAFYEDFVTLCLTEILWLGLFAWLSWLIYSVIRHGQIFFTLRLNPKLIWFVIPGVFALTIAVVSLVFRMFPNSSDEYAYVFQGETLSDSQLWDPAPAVEKAFHFNHIAIKDGIRVGRFPPGWPALLSIAFLSGIPVWLLNPLLGIFSLALFFLFVRERYSDKIAIASTLVLGFSAFYVFNSASYFSHISCLLFTILFTWSLSLIDEKKTVQCALLSGLCLGIIVTIRYFTAVLIFLPAFFYIIHRFKKQSLMIFILMAIGSVPCLGFLLWYNYQITGNPFMPVTVWAYADETLGFVHGHTYLKGVEHLVRRIFMFAYWCSPGLLILYFVLLKQKLFSTTERWAHPEDYYFLVLLLGHFFYYQIGGNQYGPRFMLESLPFLILFVVRKVFQLQSKGLLAILIASLVFAVVKFPSIALRENKVVAERHDLYDAVTKQDLANAIVVVGSPTGIIRPMPPGDLTRNDRSFRGSVLYVQNDPVALQQLRERYRGYSVYKYSRDVNSEHGILTPIH